MDFGCALHICLYDALPGLGLRPGARFERSLLAFGQFDLAKLAALAFIAGMLLWSLK